MPNIKPEIIERTIKYGEGRYRISSDGNWQVLTFGSHGPNDPPVGLSYRGLPRKPRGLAPSMNWQNNFKNHLTNSKYDSILYM